MVGCGPEIFRADPDPASRGIGILPTVSTTSNLADSTQYLRALMLPGNLSVGSIFYSRVSPIKSPVNVTLGLALGAKAIAAEADNLSSLLQHNVRLGVAAEIQGLFMIGLQHTWGWHNLTDESEKAFRERFGRENTSVRYLRVTVSFKIADSGTFLFCNWHRFSSAEAFPGYDEMRKALVMGVRKDLHPFQVFKR